ncbi:MAG TPA: phosphotransferase, partial [Opitutus sp.]|nr:phosphotransferase [Opitutus sp.]
RFVERTRGYDVVERPEQAFAAAKAFGEFQRMLVDLPGARLHETIPDFHHTRKRFENFRVAAQADPQGRAAGARAEIDFVFSREAVADVLLRLQARGEIPERVAHNDTKLNNVLLDETTNEGICVIDLDTVMPGLALHDFGEMVRTGTNSAPEDEPDPAKIAMRMPIFEALVRGYLASAGAFLNAAERAHLAFSGRLMTFENGLRFLTDHLAGDTYYKIKRPGHNLDRARNQFALLRRLEAEAAAMQALVDQLCAP